MRAKVSGILPVPTMMDTRADTSDEERSALRMSTIDVAQSIVYLESRSKIPAIGSFIFFYFFLP